MSGESQTKPKPLINEERKYTAALSYAVIMILGRHRVPAYGYRTSTRVPTYRTVGT